MARLQTSPNLISELLMLIHVILYCCIFQQEETLKKDVPQQHF